MSNILSLSTTQLRRAAVNGQDGLRVAREHKGPPIRLVVTDVIMPVMGGKVMAEWLKTTYPNLSGILLTAVRLDIVGHETADISRNYTKIDDTAIATESDTSADFTALVQL